MSDKTTRDQIVEAADQLFYRQGYEHTSFSDIADAVQISRGNFYHHFKSKDEILDAVINVRLANTQKMLEQWEIEGKQPADRIRSFIHILIVLSLDGFRKINDLLGHGIGDELIKAVADRLENSVRHSDTVARVSDDEFSLIMMGVGQANIELIARKILTAMQRPFRIRDHILHISASLGISMYPEHGDNSLHLYRNAEMAMVFLALWNCT